MAKEETQEETITRLTNELEFEKGTVRLLIARGISQAAKEGRWLRAVAKEVGVTAKEIGATVEEQS